MTKEILEKICLGTGDLLKDNIENRIKVLKIFYDEGGKLIDTARVYHNGKSLKVLKKLNERFSLIGKPSYLAQEKNITLKKNFRSIKT